MLYTVTVTFVGIDMNTGNLYPYSKYNTWIKQKWGMIWYSLFGRSMTSWNADKTAEIT